LIFSFLSAAAAFLVTFCAAAKSDKKIAGQRINVKKLSQETKLSNGSLQPRYKNYTKVTLPNRSEDEMDFLKRCTLMRLCLRQAA
jgi:hypothetical protein